MPQNHGDKWLADHIPPPFKGRFPKTVLHFTDDSRDVRPGSLYLVRPGQGGVRWDYIADALNHGAVFLVADVGNRSEWEGQVELLERLGTRAGLSFVPGIQEWTGRFASSWWGDPSRILKVIGVTGTNGKTTSSFLTRSIFQAGGMPCGLIGTVSFDVGAGSVDAPQTTPGALDLHALFADALKHGLKAMSMEVSSHALDQDRVSGTSFSVVHFTNLTRDHLDYHRDMETYFAAKKRLLFWTNPDGSKPVAIINDDDPRGGTLAEELKGKGYSFLRYGTDAGMDIHPIDVRVGISGIRGTVRTPSGAIDVESPLSGQYNLSNIMGAIGTGIVLGISPSAISSGIRMLSGVPGRFERIEGPGGFSVIVDYAHTDDALMNLLAAVRPVTSGRVITVFGCGGDRDRGKRPRMGKVAGEKSDFVVLTSDNPRTESAEAILDEIEPGLKATETRYVRVADRKSAIFEAIRIARSGDTVVIAGKGHETYQILGREKIHFDDREIARDAMRETS